MGCFISPSLNWNFIHKRSSSLSDKCIHGVIAAGSLCPVRCSAFCAQNDAKLFSTIFQNGILLGGGCEYTVCVRVPVRACLCKPHLKPFWSLLARIYPLERYNHVYCGIIDICRLTCHLLLSMLEFFNPLCVPSWNTANCLELVMCEQHSEFKWV